MSKSVFSILAGDWVRARREAAGMSQAALAEILGISQPSVSDLESGRRKLSAEELAVLAKRPEFGLTSFAEAVLEDWK